MRGVYKEGGDAYTVKTMSTASFNQQQRGPGASSELQRLLEDKQFLSIPKVGDVVRGRVLSASKTEVHIDLGYTSGVIRGLELYNESPEYSNLKIGDEVDATVVGVENELGELELSFRFAGHQKTWDYLKGLLTSGTAVDVSIVEANKGGLLVNLDHIAGFLPVSQLLPDHYPKVAGGDKSRIQEKLKSFIGQKLRVKVLDLSADEEKLIFSEKKILEDEQLERISGHKVGETVKGPITALTDFGAFMEFAPGLTGLIHISELAWQRIDHPSDVVKIGDEVEAQIININGPKVFLSRKRLMSDPWKTAEEHYKIGQMAAGKVLKVNPFGLFVELDSDIHGLCHVSEFDEKANEAGAIKIGDTLQFRIISLKPSEHRLGLSLKSESAAGETGEASLASADTLESKTDNAKESAV